MSKFYIADTHFFHDNVLKFDSRPYWNMDEMIESMISNWNSAVSKKDDAYILGDMFWKSTDAVKIMRRLNGRKHLIKGNHDTLPAELKSAFSSIEDIALIKDEGRKVFLCHYPVLFWKGQHTGAYHLYGHVHSTQEHQIFKDVLKELYSSQEAPYEECRAYNVGCMMSWMNYTPRTLDEIIAANN